MVLSLNIGTVADAMSGVSNTVSGVIAQYLLE